MIHLIAILCCFVPTYIQAIIYETPIPAVCIVPIADALTDPMATYNLSTDIKKAYQELPISWGRRDEDKKVCPRAHQLLFNEIVQILEETEEEALISITNAWYVVPLDPITARTTFWILKSNIMPLQILEQHGIEAHTIPQAISCKSSDLSICNIGVVTLYAPFFDKVTQKLYSAGTRFVRNITEDTQTSYGVYILDAQKMKLRTTTIAKNYCKLFDQRESNQQKINNFVTLLQSWANLPAGFIPCVFGGCSFTEPCKSLEFRALNRTILTGENLEYWQRESLDQPYAGFDASSILLRAAHICGIPYFYKNTLTAALNMQSLEKGESLTIGDLIWVKGGIFLISSIEQPKLITILGYSLGYGQVLELPLEKVFKDMQHFDNILSAYFNNKPLYLLSKDAGIAPRQFPEFKILKLGSIFK